MEENQRKREEEEAKRKALEEKIRNNQLKRLSTLENELHKKDAQFDIIKQQEYEKLQKIEQENEQKILDF